MYNIPSSFSYIPTSWVRCVCFSTSSDVAHAVLDRCMSDNATEENPDIVNSRNYEVTFDFEFLQDWRPHKAKLSSHTTRRNRRNWNLELGEAHGSPTVDVASSVGNSDLSKEEKQATKWKPEGFSKLHHPLHLMVRELSSSVQTTVNFITQS